MPKSTRLGQHTSTRDVDIIGEDADSSESESEGEWCETATEDEEGLESTSSSEGEEDVADDFGRDIYEAPDGTRWNLGPPPTPSEPWRTQLHDYHDGPRNGAENPNLSILQVFQLFITPDTVADICKWTNQWGSHITQKWNSSHPTEPTRTWNDTDDIEIYSLIGLLLLGGVEKARRKPWKQLWSKDETIRCPPFVATMSRTRFSSLMAALRFDDASARHARKATTSQASRSDPRTRLEPIQDVFSKVVQTFAHYYTPAAKLCVDEQIIQFRGRCSFRVYSPDKPAKYGIKVWALVDNSSGYMLKLQIYHGRGAERQFGLGRQVVLELVEDYRNSERGIIADNFFSSYALVSDLLQRKLTFCGTIRTNRREIPLALRNFRLLPRPDAFLYNHELMTTLVRHMHRPQKFVLLISSAHYDDSMVDIDKRHSTKKIPEIVDYYNCNKGGVDVADYKISSYTAQYPSRRWPVKVFIHTVDCAGINAFAIWTRNHPNWKEGAGGGRRRMFLRDLAYALIKPQITKRAANTSRLQSYVKSAMAVMGIPYQVTQAPAVPSSSRALPTRCTFCTTTRTRSRFSCRECHKSICEIHTKRLCPTCYQRYNASHQEDAIPAMELEEV